MTLSGTWNPGGVFMAWGVQRCCGQFEVTVEYPSGDACEQRLDQWVWSPENRSRLELYRFERPSPQRERERTISYGHGQHWAGRICWVRWREIWKITQGNISVMDTQWISQCSWRRSNWNSFFSSTSKNQNFKILFSVFATTITIM